MSPNERLCRFFELLIKVDMRNNPKMYIKNEEPVKRVKQKNAQHLNT